MITEKERKWIKRMQKAGLFPPSPPPPAPPPPEGQWSATSLPGGIVFLQVNKVPVSQETAIALMKLQWDEPA